MDRVTDFESGGWGFDSLWGRFTDKFTKIILRLRIVTVFWFNPVCYQEIIYAKYLCCNLINAYKPVERVR